MYLRYLIFAGVILLTLTACASSLSSLTAGPPPSYYDLEYVHQPVDCSRSIEKVVRVWPFSASSPFDRSEMIVLDLSHQVSFSPQYRWITSPGTLLADKVIQDMSKSKIFSKIVSAGDSYITPFSMGGRVFKFAWEKSGTSGRAVLDVEVSLWSTAPEPDVLFRQRYRFESPPAEAAGPERLAEAMSGLVREFSEQLRRDICAMPLKGSSSQAGG